MSILRHIFKKPCTHYMVLSIGGPIGRTCCDWCGFTVAEWYRR